jgi:hypothetical protein
MASRPLAVTSVAIPLTRPIERMVGAAGGNIDYLPADFLGWDRYARLAAPRVVATAVAPMDERGFFSLGLHCGATPARAAEPGRASCCCT